MMATVTATPFVEAIALMADASRDIVKRAALQFAQPITKSDGSPVTEFDREVERALRAIVAARFPDHGIIGEEYGSDKTDAEYVWIFDPIDGTKQFITGIPEYGTLIALAHHGIPILGVIDCPATGDRWMGGVDVPATRNGLSIKTRACNRLDSAIFKTSGPGAHNFEPYGTLMALAKAARFTVYGGGCFAFGLLAEGRIDFASDAGHNVYDFAAPAAVVQAAGGIVTDWQGQPLSIHSNGNFLMAGDRSVHAIALNVLQEANSRG
ncbi:MAG: inositol monophosphatase family protein [Cyanobacteria bacterium P01_F01_bin.33]